MSLSNNIIINESGTATHIENYKIVILGDQFVGKTSILHKYKYETADEGYAVKIFKLYIADCRNRLFDKKRFSGGQNDSFNNVGHSRKRKI